jgi:uncharacterized protein (DUF427 family)
MTAVVTPIVRLLSMMKGAMTMRNRVKPGPGQESVWDYPRPPRLEATSKEIRIVFNGETIVETRCALRVLETSHPPVYYIPPDDIRPGILTRTTRRSYCEWKGEASYYTLKVGDRTISDGAWSYHEPVAEFRALTDYIAFYPGQMDGCFVEGERVTPQPGGFYGGWITRDVVGPFKGELGTCGW